MPEGTVAPAASPAPAAVSAPAPVAAPAAPAAPATPAVEAPAAEPAAPAAAPAAPAEGEAAPAAAPAAAGPKEPSQDEFPGDVQAFLEAHSAWERKRDGIEDPAAPAEAAPAEGEVKPAEEQPKPGEAEVAPTPEALNALTKESPLLQAAIDGDPKVKNALFAMARTVAKLEPIGKIFPNVESAEYAAEASNRFTNHRINFLEAADNPESFPTAYEAFAEEFVEKGQDGKPLLDAGGNPVYGEDFQMLNDYIVDTYHDVEIGDLKAALEANKFTSEDEREQTDMALQALEFIKNWKKGQATAGGIKKPDLSGLPEETRAFYEAKDKELAEREAKLNGQEKTQTTEQRQAARATFETEIVREVGGSVGKRVASLVADKEKIGAFIPSYILTTKDPATGIPVFAKTMLDQFEEATYGRVDRATGKVIGGVAFIRNQAKMLAKRPPSPEAKQARVDFMARLIDEHLPGIFEKNFRELQNQDIADKKRTQGNVDARRELTTPEPRAGSAPAPKAVDPASAMKTAYTWVDQNFPDLTPSERTEKALIKKNELLGSRY